MYLFLKAKTMNTIEMMKDIDGNEYKTVKIGNQIWMAENLRVTRFNNGDNLFDIVKIDSFSGPFFDRANNEVGDSSACYCNYNFDISLDKKYGKLYNPAVIFDSRSIAPTGWRIPDNSDWEELIQYIRDLKNDFSIIGAKDKLKSKEYWLSENLQATDDFGFNGLPGGWWFSNDGKFIDLGYNGYFWSKSLTGADYDFENRMEITHDQLITVGGNYSWLSIRCVRNI